MPHQRRHAGDSLGVHRDQKAHNRQPDRRSRQGSSSQDCGKDSDRSLRVSRHLGRRCRVFAATARAPLHIGRGRMDEWSCSCRTIPIRDPKHTKKVFDCGSLTRGGRRPALRCTGCRTSLRTYFSPFTWDNTSAGSTLFSAAIRINRCSSFAPASRRNAFVVFPSYAISTAVR